MESGTEEGTNSETDEVVEQRWCEEENVAMDLETGIPEEPKIGLSFENLEKLCKFYGEYGKLKGFSVMRISGKKGGDAEYKFITLGCHRARNPRRDKQKLLQHRPSMRIGCKARLSASRQSDGRWRINRVNVKHNHHMTPSKSRYLKQHRYIPPHVKRRLELNDTAGIRLSKTYRALVNESGGYEKMTSLERDLRNYIVKIRKLKLGEGDAEAVMQMFGRMKEKNSEFYHTIKLDKEGRMKHLFWADSRSRAAYKEFGDVVSVDTTYLLNRYHMPFVPFVGVNHHGQSILLGCALISNEKATTFCWLFKEWLQCMDGVSPPAIITDQCASIAKAIDVVFPLARHRWCLWHITCKFSDKMKGYKNFYDIKQAMMAAIYDSVSIEEFETAWEKMLNDFNLHGNSWLGDLYEGKERWVPIYVNREFGRECLQLKGVRALMPFLMGM